ncbi:MAG: GntR family transcriptional regulator [Candidatus Kaistia colombiensis]|nr:MAG: GntR family transcriptional regulator [Kaistia sp.]
MKARKMEQAVDSSPDSAGAAASLESFQPRPLSRDDGPLYRQLVTILREPIANGTLVPGTSLPREADIAEQFGVSLITVRQALRDLENDGLIKKRAAKPAVVTAPESPAKPSFGFRSFAQIADSTRDRALADPLLSQGALRNAPSAAFGLQPGRELPLPARDPAPEGMCPACQTTFYFPPADRLPPQAHRFRRRRRLPRRPAPSRHPALHRAHHRPRRCRRRGPGRERSTTRSAARSSIMEMLYFSASGEPVELTINKNRADLFSLSYDAPNDLI